MMGTARTFARFLRHSVQALGVTTPRPRRLLEPAAVAGRGAVFGALGVPVLVEEESAWAGVPAAADFGGGGGALMLDAVGVGDAAEAAWCGPDSEGDGW